jgi:hypothetical protein
LGTTHAVTGVDTSSGVVMLFENGEAETGECNAGGAASGIAVITYNLRAFTPVRPSRSALDSAFSLVFLLIHHFLLM